MTINKNNTVLMTAYDVDPFKGGESQIGWKIPFLMSQYFEVILVTRKNNKPNILKFVNENKIDTKKLRFLFYDLPYFMRFWKIGRRGSSLYFYLWQMCIPLFLRIKKVSFELTHSVNFVSDTFPHFLWLTGKPSIWGPISHHEKIPLDAFGFYGNYELIKDRLIWFIKNYFWKFDIFNYLARKYSSKILASNKSVQKRMNINENKIIYFPSSAIDRLPHSRSYDSKKITFLIVARAVPLKSIDITINAYNKFLKNNCEIESSLNIVGGGKYLKNLRKLTDELDIATSVNFFDSITYDQLGKIYAESTIFVSSSHEGGGLAVIEAMSYGLPVICFDNFGPGELVSDECAFKINYKNYNQAIDEFADAMSKLSLDNDNLKKMSLASINRVNHDFLWHKRADYLKEIYLEIL